MEMKRRIVALSNAVGAIGIRHHGERFVVKDQLIDQGFHILIMHIVVSRSVHQEEIALKTMGERDGGSWDRVA